jgi:hypothetical protein
MIQKLQQVLLGAASATLLLFAAHPVAAQTTAVGPYYATPSWDQVLPASTRFIVLSNFNNNAVLDRETGLVWELTPTVPTNSQNWRTADFSCHSANTGGRAGWRLPSIAEISSLFDRSVTTPYPAGVSLPPGHPFIGVTALQVFGTATPTPGVPGFGPGTYGMQFDTHISPTPDVQDASPTSLQSAWCVRGGSPAQ